MAYGDQTILQRRQQVQKVQNSQGHTRRFAKRAVRDASRMARKSGNPLHSQLTLKMMEQAEDLGVNPFGVSDHAANRNYAAATLGDFARDNALARRATAPASARVGSGNLGRAGDHLMGPQASNISPTNGGGGYTAAQAGASSPGAATTPQPGDVQSDPTAFRPQQATGRGFINGKPTDEVVGAPRAPGIYQPAPDSDRKFRKDRSPVPSELQIQTESGEYIAADSPEGTLRGMVLSDRSGETDYSGALQSARDNVSGFHLDDQIELGQVQETDLTPEQAEDLMDARDFDKFKEDEEKYGRDGALGALIIRKRKRAEEAAKAKEQSDVEQARKQALRPDVSRMTPTELKQHTADLQSSGEGLIQKVSSGETAYADLDESAKEAYDFASGKQIFDAIESGELSWIDSRLSDEEVRRRYRLYKSIVAGGDADPTQSAGSRLANER